MSILSMIPIFGKFLDKGLNVIDKLVPDKDLANKLKTEIKSQAMNQDHSELVEQLKAQMNIILAEAKSDSWLAANWRPLIMVLFGVIIANNYILNPWLNALFDINVMMEIPTDMWALLKLGLGGYVIGRSAEKAIKVYKEKK